MQPNDYNIADSMFAGMRADHKSRGSVKTATSKLANQKNDSSKENLNGQNLKHVASDMNSDCFEPNLDQPKPGPKMNYQYSETSLNQSNQHKYQYPDHVY